LKVIENKRVRNLYDDYQFELNKNNKLVELYLKNITKYNPDPNPYPNPNPLDRWVF